MTFIGRHPWPRTHHPSLPPMHLSYKGVTHAAVLLLLGLAPMSQAEAAKKGPSGKSHDRSLGGQIPPELRSQAAHWVNRKAGRLTLKSLRGKTVWLQFNF